MDFHSTKCVASAGRRPRRRLGSDFISHRSSRELIEEKLDESGAGTKQKKYVEGKAKVRSKS